MGTGVPQEEVGGQAGAVQVWYCVSPDCHPSPLGPIVMLQVIMH